MCLFNFCQIFVVVYQTILALGLMKERADSAARSALDLPHAKVGVPYNDFKHCINQYILSLGNMIGMVQLRTSFILLTQSWDIGSPPTGSAGRMKLSCVVPTSVIRI